MLKVRIGGAFQGLCLAFCVVLGGCSGDTAHEAPPGSAKGATDEVANPNLHVQPRGSAKNLLLICIDTVRADVFYRLGELKKDSLSSWQESAVVFEQADSAAPWTLPSLGSVFSGLWPLQHGAGLLPGLHASVADNLPGGMYTDVAVFPRAALNQEFKTAIISASGWTISKNYSGQLLDGFTEIADFTGTIEQMADNRWQPMVAKWRELFRRDTQSNSALHFLHLMEAHNWHFSPVPELEERIATLTVEQRDLYLQIAPARACEVQESEICKRYLVYVMAIDYLRDGIAAVLEALQKDGKLENTAVVVFSDHGEEFADHRDDGRKARSDGRGFVFWGHGQSLYQEQLHVPLLVWHPAYQGAKISQPVSLIDIAPTVARWLDVDFMPEHWQGRFLDDYIQSPQNSIDRVVYASSISMGEQQYSARVGSKKSILYLASDFNKYFDLAVDPRELQSAPGNEMVMLFDGYLLDYMQQVRKSALATGRFDAEQIRRLQAIGYLQGVDPAETGKTPK